MPTLSMMDLYVCMAYTYKIMAVPFALGLTSSYRNISSVYVSFKIYASSLRS